jgi:GNAT superfamily N-acetyltransferase
MPQPVRADPVAQPSWPEGFSTREPQPGDLGWVIHRHAALYAEHGYDWRFEALVAEVLAQFVRSFDPQHERAWIALRGDAIVGSVFVVRKDDATAQLRLLYVEPSARGAGLGRALVDACIAFAKARGYRRMMLWTQAELHSACRIYEAAGFTLAESTPHRSFGFEQVGQVWTLELRDGRRITARIR